MYKFKNIAKRSTAFAAAVGLLGAVGTSVLPALASADALNPLTERTLLLSSSSPGNHFTDGAGNGTFAPAGSGANGKKTGETFTFKVSTDSVATSKPIKAFTFQYCTTAAGNCTGPGDSSADLEAVFPSAAIHTNFDIYVGGGERSITNFVDSTTIPAGTAESTGWALTAGHLENGAGGTARNKDNLITLATTGAGISPTAGTQISIVFRGTEDNYITNPGSDKFFVKINDFDSATSPDPLDDTHIIDGGVTVANVMTDSIQITTKVLETMDFSVGTVNPDLVHHNPSAPDNDSTQHGSCDAITTNNAINLGDSTAEFSLKTATAYDGNSYWRLSSNSSNGATVYYSGTTLNNTVGDEIKPMDWDQTANSGAGAYTATASAISHPGKEQFGLALTDNDDDSALDTSNSSTALSNSLSPLQANPTYADGAGNINGSSIDAKFFFETDSNTIPQPLAAESTDVVTCATGKMRYLANIAASTPAGIYSTKINYLAAPQY